MFQIAAILIVFLMLIFPMGKYLHQIAFNRPSKVDFIFNPFEGLVLRLTCLDGREMSWQQYATALVSTNLVMALLAYGLLSLQSVFPGPGPLAPLTVDLALNTAISFITNTNLQHYAGESALTIFSQTAVITLMMFASAATGLSAGLAFIRGLAGQKMGNYYVDMIRIFTRLLLPLALAVGILLISQGVPQTLTPQINLTTMEEKSQAIPIGPVASLESIKHLGTNGGGYFSTNSATPFENPSITSNIIEILAMMLLPGACVVAFGLALANRQSEGSQIKAVPGTTPMLGGEGRTVLVAMAFIFLIGLGLCLWAETSPNPGLTGLGLDQSQGNLEGKETRFGPAQSALFSAVTTSFSTGSVNNTHNSLNPLGGLAVTWQMMLNVAFGGLGVGLMNMMVYVLLAVFLGGLMIGRTPVYLGKKIESREMKLCALILIMQPLLILVASAWAAMTPAGLQSISQPGAPGLTQILYEFTSAAANNGSGFEGLADNTLFWNLSTAVIMFISRYGIITLQLALAGSLLAKAPVKVSAGSLRTDSWGFVVLLIVVVFIFSALTFLPVLSLGPIAELLTL